MPEKIIFERYTTASRQVIFFARAEASWGGSKVIDTEHILLGLVRVDSETIQKVAPLLSLEWIRSRAVSWHIPKENVPTSVDMPLSEQAAQALKAAEATADNHGSTFIRTEHLLLALMTVPSSHAALLLDEAGGTIRSLEECIAQLSGDGQQAGVVLSSDDFS